MFFFFFWYNRKIFYSENKLYFFVVEISMQEKIKNVKHREKSGKERKKNFNLRKKKNLNLISIVRILWKRSGRGKLLRPRCLDISIKKIGSIRSREEEQNK